MSCPCVICGETEPKGWEQFGGGWAGHWTECPQCGHIAKYINMCHYDPITKTSSSTGAPEWVYRLINLRKLGLECAKLEADKPLVI